MAASRNIRCLQVNTGRRRVSHDLVRAASVRENTDVVICSEPNKTMAKSEDWIVDERADTMIEILNRELKILGQGKGNGFVWVEMESAVLYSCYISPNTSIATFGEFLTDLQWDLKRHTKKTVIAGDFNVKSYQWSLKEDHRGKEMAEWLSQENLVVINTANQPTFQRYEQESIIDLTLCNRHTARHICHWRVADEETLSWHKIIFLEIRDPSGPRVTEKSEQCQLRGWKLSQEKLPEFGKTLRKNLDSQRRGGQSINVTKFTDAVTKTCDSVFAKRSGYAGKNKGVYWWSNEIKDLRKACIQARRICVRSNKKGPEEAKQAAANDNKLERKRLKAAIKTSKQEAWKRLIEDLDEDIWGRGFKIATGKLRKKAQIEKEEQWEEAVKLFPETETANWPMIGTGNKGQEFDEDELLAATYTLKDQKAARPDGIPPELAKASAKYANKEFQEIANTVLQTEKFPTSWKTARLALIEKQKRKKKTRLHIDQYAP